MRNALSRRRGAAETEEASLLGGINLQLLIKVFESLPPADYFSITQCFISLNDPSLAFSLIAKLVNLETSEPPKTTPSSPPTESPSISPGLWMRWRVRKEHWRRTTKPVANQHRERLAVIPNGQESITLYFDILYRNDNAGLLIVRVTLCALKPRNSIYRTAISLAKAFASAGTTSDPFLRENLDLLGEASSWSGYTTTAALGVIHKGNLA
ncbi:26S proteasome non-ATPase regulatory subunit 1 [Rhodotorula toruloides ATCC 204091]|uniref:26S proteasome non-ATPase regulatory subunit 1 n=1 Tax=Rhodotorula toruloides TaxID=5286 RepID=A0A0K3CIX7_RHOTO|nr:26S proteasome non-ATPase regulatory subunit 1 [Rhodotorula toruloides ATCC 204091]PRQ73115.1 26S proteasome non-ATPase regulatory subunit 1 [Rhodotorula toruloides]